MADSPEHQVSDQQDPTAADISNAAQVAAESPIGRGSQCTAVKSDGSPCAARAITGSSLCFFHDPALAGARAAASKRGGEKTRAAALPPDTPDAPLSNAAELSALLGRTINQLLRGELDPKIANTVGYLLTVMMKTADLGKLEQRLAALEIALKEKQAEPSLFEPDEFGGA